MATLRATPFDIGKLFTLMMKVMVLGKLYYVIKFFLNLYKTNNRYYIVLSF